MVENKWKYQRILFPFYDKLGAAKLYTIVSGQPVDDSIKENLFSLEEAGKQLMSEYRERMSTKIFSESTMMASETCPNYSRIVHANSHVCIF